MSLDRYYNLFNSAFSYADLLFRSGDGLQSRELNEMQSWLVNRVAEIGDAIFKEGNVIRGADISVNADTGAVTAEAGYLYLRGAVRPVDSATRQSRRTALLQSVCGSPR